MKASESCLPHRHSALGYKRIRFLCCNESDYYSLETGFIDYERSTGPKTVHSRSRQWIPELDVGSLQEVAYSCPLHMADRVMFR